MLLNYSNVGYIGGITTENNMFQVIDMHTKSVKGTYSTMKRALNVIDKLDNAYGAYRYTLKKVIVQQ